jgi:hypothetical protein
MAFGRELRTRRWANTSPAAGAAESTLIRVIRFAVSIPSKNVAEPVGTAMMNLACVF